MPYTVVESWTIDGTLFEMAKKLGRAKEARMLMDILAKRDAASSALNDAERVYNATIASITNEYALLDDVETKTKKRK